MNLYVSNLSYSMTDDELNAAFAAYGVVSSARVVLERESGRSRGFGFVEMPVETEALTAINALNGADMGGRPLRVVEARPKEERPQQRRDFGGGGGGGQGGGWKQRDRGDRDGGKGDWDRNKRQ
jgi:RNA recognition motif-containing protein